MYYLFEDIDGFDVWISEINAYFGYPNPDTKTDTYTISIDNVNNSKIACVVDDKVPESLTRTNYTREELVAEGFAQFEMEVGGE